MLSRLARLGERLRPWATTILLLAAIVAGGGLGAVAPEIGAALAPAVDPLLLALVTVLFATLRVESLRTLHRQGRTLVLVLGVNFLLVPLLALPLTAIIPDPALRLGALIYCLAPCTDWFLGFTRLAGGNTGTGAALIPVQVAVQLALFPVWLALFGGQQVEATLATAGPVLLQWFVVPAAIGLTARFALRRALRAPLAERLFARLDDAVPFVIAALIVAIFGANASTVLANPAAFGWVLAVTVAFFAVTFLLGAFLARRLHLTHPDHVVLAMSTSARNAPLMLAVTLIALPDQPSIAAAIVLGMLIEFPHLTLITHLLRRRDPEAGTASEVCDEAAAAGAPARPSGQALNRA